MKLYTARRVRSRSLDDALLPLINVVFLLMIFFLAAGRFGAPKPLAGTPQSLRSEVRAAAQVLELQDGAQLLIDGVRFADAELPGRALAWQGKPLDLKAPGLVPAERVLRLLAILRAAGVSDVRLLTVKVSH